MGKPVTHPTKRNEVIRLYRPGLLVCLDDIKTLYTKTFPKKPHVGVDKKGNLFVKFYDYRIIVLTRSEIKTGKSIRIFAARAKAAAFFLYCMMTNPRVIKEISFFKKQKIKVSHAHN